MTRETDRDTRRFRRHSMRLLVDYTCEGDMHCDYATSLSVGGLFIETDAGHTAGSTVKMRFRLPGSETLHEIEGRVTWRYEPRPGEAQRAPGLGVDFADETGSNRLARELEEYGA
jgi:uncharacterized protein (TIGR02266 family)